MTADIVGPTATYQDKTRRYNPVQAFQVYRKIQIESTWFGEHKNMYASPGDFIVTYQESGDQLVFPAEQFIKIYEPMESNNE